MFYSSKIAQTALIALTLATSASAVLALGSDPIAMPNYPPFSTFSEWSDAQQEAYKVAAFVSGATIVCQDVPGFADIAPESADYTRRILRDAPFSADESETVAAFVEAHVDLNARIANPDEIPATIACSIMLGQVRP